MCEQAEHDALHKSASEAVTIGKWLHLDQLALLYILLTILTKPAKEELKEKLFSSEFSTTSQIFKKFYIICIGKADIQRGEREGKIAHLIIHCPSGRYGWN